MKGEIAALIANWRAEATAWEDGARAAEAYGARPHEAKAHAETLRACAKSLEAVLRAASKHDLTQETP